MKSLTTLLFLQRIIFLSAKVNSSSDNLLLSTRALVKIKATAEEIEAEAIGFALINAELEIAEGEVVVNLLTNTYQAMKETGGTLTVTTNQKADGIEITISDTGPGISPENQKKIFEAFFSTKTKGIGLGLYIAKQIVDQHQGTIAFNTEEGKGTTFIVQKNYWQK